MRFAIVINDPGTSINGLPEGVPHTYVVGPFASSEQASEYASGSELALGAFTTEVAELESPLGGDRTIDRTELEHYASELRMAEATIREQLAVLQRIRGSHRRNTGSIDVCIDDRQAWPCRTVRWLNGELA